MTTSNYMSLENQAKEYLTQNDFLLVATEKYLSQSLTVLCQKYCAEHNLPPEAIRIRTRRKSIASFINKLNRRGVIDIKDGSDAMTDTIGARVICWFVDDCFGILEAIKEDPAFKIIPHSIENFIENPKETGYRSIHVLNEINTDSLDLEPGIKLHLPSIISEIQIRTKLQDSWAEITHEFHYKAKYAGINNPTYESLLGDISDRLAIEDKTLLKFRDAYGKLADDQRNQDTAGLSPHL